jgi:hypothetical protein
MLHLLPELRIVVTNLLPGISDNAGAQTPYSPDLEMTASQTAASYIHVWIAVMHSIDPIECNLIIW